MPQHAGNLISYERVLGKILGKLVIVAKIALWNSYPICRALPPILYYCITMMVRRSGGAECGGDDNGRPTAGSSNGSMPINKCRVMAVPL